MLAIGSQSEENTEHEMEIQFIQGLGFWVSEARFM